MDKMQFDTVPMGFTREWLFAPPKQATFFDRTYLNTLNFREANPDYSLLLNPRFQLFLITCPVLSVWAKTH